MDFNKLIEDLKAAGVTKFSLSFEFGEKKVEIDNNTVDLEEAEDKPKEHKHDSGDELRKTKPNYYSEQELANICKISQSRINGIIREAEVPFVKVGRTKFYDIEVLWLKRSDHEQDVLVNDGHRRGGTKFICDILYKHIVR